MVRASFAQIQQIELMALCEEQTIQTQSDDFEFDSFSFNQAISDSMRPCNTILI